MAKCIDETGKTYGQLTAIKRVESTGRNRTNWLFKCSCGKEKVCRLADVKYGDIKSCGCLHNQQRENNNNWGGGRHKVTGGYIQILKPDHPNSNKKGYVLEHIYVMSQHIGRPLEKGETVHHKNGIKDQNNIENLELWIGNHCPGQRVSDLIKWAKDLLLKYDLK